MLRQLAFAAGLPPAQGPSSQAAQEAALARRRFALVMVHEWRLRRQARSAGAGLGPILALGVGGKVLHARQPPLNRLARLGAPGAVLRNSRVAKRRELRRTLRDVDVAGTPTLRGSCIARGRAKVGSVAIVHGLAEAQAIVRG